MASSVHVFWGSNQDFEDYVSERINEFEFTITYLELISAYNTKMRTTLNSATSETSHFYDAVDNVVVRSADFGSVSAHVIYNFAAIALQGCNFETMYIQNPPRQVLRSLQTAFPDCLVHATTEYKDVNKNILLDVHRRLAATILGQKVCKKEIDLSLYRISKMGKEKPAVLLFYGPSGVGKTETAKQLSEALGGGLTRIQFSMFQNQEAFDYLFGGEHSKGSFARDLLARESNVVLLDEFDKVNPGLYNAFYELFDEGVLVDSYYRVEMGSAVFILTSNFGSEEEIKKALGPAMFSRIGACIKFEQLTPEELKKLINRHFDYLLQHLDDEEVSLIEQCGVRDWFLANASKFDNVRTLNQKIERAIFGVLTNKLLKEGSVD